MQDPRSTNVPRVPPCEALIFYLDNWATGEEGVASDDFNLDPVNSYDDINYLVTKRIADHTDAIEKVANNIFSLLY